MAFKPPRRGRAVKLHVPNMSKSSKYIQIYQNHQLNQWLNRFLHVPIYSHWSHHCYTTPTELFQPRPPHFPVMGTKCLACSRIPTRCVWRNLSPQANEVWRYDHKSLWKPFTQPALLVQQFKHHNMRSAVMPSMSLANLRTNPFLGISF